jgi:hypothetical protein
MATWLWLNIPLSAVFFLATAGIPLWLVLTRPDWSGGKKRPQRQQSAATQAETRRPQKARSRRRLQLTH